MKAFKYKLKVNDDFEREALRTLDVCRELYNASIQERRDAYKMSGVSVNYHSQAIQLPEIKQDRPDLKDVFSQVLQDVLRRSDKAFDAFFRRIKAGQTPGYPRFKGKDRFNSFTYPQSGFRVEGDKLFLSKIGSVRLRLSRPIEGQIKTCTITKEVDGWYVCFACEIESKRIKHPSTETVGVDVGIESFATLSTGEQIENPKFLRASEKDLKKAQRRVSRRKLRSNRRKKAVKLLAKQHQKVARQRKDFHFKVANRLVKDFRTIKFEHLNIKGMVQNHRLAKSISDAGWGNFIQIVANKAEEAGGQVEQVKAAYTSQTCSRCGHRHKISLSERVYRCGDCGLVIDRDHNAGINIKNGRAVHASRGKVASVNDTRTTSQGESPTINGLPF
jgi:putative transposase